MLRVAVVFVYLSVASGCASHVRLVVAATEPGAAEYDCESGSCQPTTSIDPGAGNPARTRQINLPAECQGRIHKVMIFDAGSKNPKAHVICAAPDDGIQPMGLAPFDAGEEEAR